MLRPSITAWRCCRVSTPTIRRSDASRCDGPVEKAWVGDLLSRYFAAARTRSKSITPSSPAMDAVLMRVRRTTSGSSWPAPPRYSSTRSLRSCPSRLSRSCGRPKRFGSR